MPGRMRVGEKNRVAVRDGHMFKSTTLSNLSHTPHQQSTMMADTALGQPGGGGWQ